MKAAYNSERAFGGLLSAGLCFDLVCQAFVNMGVVVGLGPVTGQPLPLISMGGTSMVFTALALGIVLSVSRGEQDEVWQKKTSSAEAKEGKENKNIATPKAA
jgi:cell division protein FtsW